MAVNIERWSVLDSRVMDSLDATLLTPDEVNEYLALCEEMDLEGLVPNCPCHGQHGSWRGWDSADTGDWGSDPSCPGCTTVRGEPRPLQDRLTIADRIGVMNTAEVLTVLDRYEDSTGLTVGHMNS